MTSEAKRFWKWAGGAGGVALLIGWFVLAGYADDLASKYITAKACKSSVSKESYSKDMGEIKDMVLSMKRMMAIQAATITNTKIAMEKHGVEVREIFKPEYFMSQ